MPTIDTRMSRPVPGDVATSRSPRVEGSGSAEVTGARLQRLHGLESTRFTVTPG